MSDYTTKQAVEFAYNKDVNNFRTAVGDILMDKIAAAVDLKKIEVASNFLNQNTEEESEGETTNA